MFEVLVYEFNDYAEIREAIKQHSSEYAQFEGSGAERTEFLYEIARNFYC